MSRNRSSLNILFKTNKRENLSVRRSEDPVTRDTLALHRHKLLLFSNRDNPRSEDLPFVFGPEAQF